MAPALDGSAANDGPWALSTHDPKDIAWYVSLCCRDLANRDGGASCSHLRQPLQVPDLFIHRSLDMNDLLLAQMPIFANQLEIICHRLRSLDRLGEA